MLLDQSERQFHIRTLPQEVGKYVILPGDPGRVPKIAAYLDNAKQVASNREYNVYTGTLDGEKVTVCSTGIGGPSAAIAVEELYRCGATTLIRIGTSGGINLDVWGGDLLIAQAAVRAEGTSHEYLPDEYPAVANMEVIHALEESAAALSTEEMGNRYHVGVIQSKDSFYGEIEPLASAVGPKLKEKWDAYVKLGCLTSEMECASIFSVALNKGMRAGAVLTALWNAERSARGMEDHVVSDSTRAIECAVGAIRLLIRRDRLS